MHPEFWGGERWCRCHLFLSTPQSFILRTLIGGLCSHCQPLQKEHSLTKTESATLCGQKDTQKAIRQAHHVHLAKRQQWVPCKGCDHPARAFDQIHRTMDMAGALHPIRKLLIIDFRDLQRPAAAIAPGLLLPGQWVLLHTMSTVCLQLNDSVGHKPPPAACRAPVSHQEGSFLAPT